MKKINFKQCVQKARWLLTLGLLLTLGVGQMWARTVYFDTDGLTFKDNATNFAIYLWGGGDGNEWHILEHVSGNIYSAEVSDSRVNCIFCSMNSHTTGWSNKTGQTDDQNKFTSNNYFTVTNVNLSGNNDGKISGSWSLYSATPSVSLDASSTSVECGASVTFTATGNNLGGESATYKFEDITGGGSSVIQEASSTYTCTTSWATAGTKTVKVTMKVGDDEYTDTYDVTIVSYIYFYAAVPNGWGNNNTKVSIGSSSSTDTLTAYNNTSLAYSNAKSVYEAVSSTAPYNSGNTYNIKIYRVPSSDAGQNVYVGNNGWCFDKAAIGQVASGKLYTLTSGDNGGTYMAANAISVNSVSASGPYAIDAVTLTSYISAYGTSTSNLRTAGGDTFTTTYTLNDQTASTSTVITPEVSNTYTSNTGNLAGSITIDPSDLTAGHTYTLTVTIADDITGKMTSSATSSSFAISNPSYKVYYGVHESGHGTLAATYTSGGASIGSSGSSVAYGSGLTFTATPSQTYYEVEGFYSDEDCTSSLQSGNSTTYTIASLSGETNVYVKFKLKDFTVTYNNMTGATNDAGNPSSVTYETTAVTLGDPEKTGYTFDGWYDNSSFTGSKVTTIPTHTTADVGLWAKWTENMSTLSVNRTIDEGSPSIAAPTVTGSYTNVGYATTRTITAAAAATGYALTGWTITNGTRTDGGGATANPITVRSNGNASETVTVTANYSIQSYTISSTNTNVTYSPTSGTSFKFGSTGDKMTITPKSGYKITDIDSDNGAITASADNNAAGSWTVTGTMPGTNVTLDITTASVPEVRILGRFRIYNSTRTAYSSLNGTGNLSWTSSYNDSHISMTYNHQTGCYDLPTYRTYAELKADNDGGALYVWPETSSRKYGAKGGGDITAPTSKPASANIHDYSGGASFKFDGTSTLLYVVLHFDMENLKFWISGTEDTEYSTTFYAGEYGSISADGNAISANSSASVDIGFERTLTATPSSASYYFIRWETTGSVSVSNSTSASTKVTATGAGGTVTAVWGVNSGWYCIGDQFGEGDSKWQKTNTSYPFDHAYPGETNVFYREVTFPNGTWYFRFHNTTDFYGAGVHNKEITKGSSWSNLSQYDEQSFKFSVASSTAVWVVIDVSGDTKKIRIQDPYYKVTFGDNLGGSAVSAVDGSSVSITSGSAYAGGTAITFSKSDPAGYDFIEWNTAADGSGTQLGTGSTYSVPSLSEEISVYAIYEEHSYTVTVSAGAGGSVSTTSVTAGPETESGSITATANTGYYFTGWTYSVDGKVTEHQSSYTGAASTLTINATAAVTMTANFAVRYALVGATRDNESTTAGMPGWSSGDAAAFTYSDGTYTINRTLTKPNTNYSFKVIDRRANEWIWYGLSTADTWIDMNTATNLTSTSNNANIYSLGTGSYTFTVTEQVVDAVTYPRVTISNPSSWQVHMGAVTDNGQTGGSATAVDGESNTIVNDNWVKNGGSVTFTHSAAAAGYEFVDWRTSSTYGDGSQLGTGSTYTASSIEADVYAYAHFKETKHTISLGYTGEGEIQDAGGAPTGSVSVGTYTTATITAVPASGYYFNGWTIPDGVTVTSGSSSTAEITIKTTSDDKTVTANFHADDKIYFDNTYTQWANVYVYLFNSDVWYQYTPNEGVHPNWAGKVVGYAQMTKVPGDDNLYEYAYHNSSHNYSFSHVAFGEADQHDNTAFYDMHCAYRSDWHTNLPVYVATAGYELRNVTAKYHSGGYWRPYNPKAGESVKYFLDVFSGTADFQGETQFFKASGDGSLVAEVSARLTDANTTYTFGVHSDAGGSNNQHYAESTTITNDNSDNYLKLYKYNDKWNISVETSSEGIYTFVLSMEYDSLRFSVIYPASVGDYRLTYSYDSPAKTRSSDIMKKKVTDAGAVHTSMYVDPTNLYSELILERCSTITEGKPEWEPCKTFDHSYITSKFATKEVYEMDVTVSGTNGTTSTLSNIAKYTGPFYIKTDCAIGGWADYTKNAMDQNSINYSALDSKTFNYYFVKYIEDARKKYGTNGWDACNLFDNAGNKTNVKCVVANMYNNSISDTLKSDIITGDGQETLPMPGSVRFSYNSATNEIKRTYLNGSTCWADAFLLLTADKTIKTPADVSIAGNATTFADKNNWVYELQIKAPETTKVWLKATFNSTPQDLIGTSSSYQTLIGGSDADHYQLLRIIYDFKTNKLIAAWEPDQGTVYSEETIDLASDVLMIHNRRTVASATEVGKIDDVTMINLTTGGGFTGIGRIYCAMRFQKTSADGFVGLKTNTAGSEATALTSAESYYRFNYWISFPYDVKMTDIFGIDGYGSKWRIQRYRGDLRAQNGWYLGDGVGSFWETVPMSDTEKLNAKEGYVLQLSPSSFRSSAMWNNSATERYLYFPSGADISVVDYTTSSVTLTSLPCTKGTFSDPTQAAAGYSHNITDSHWHVFGIPTFYNATGTTGTGTYHNGDTDEGTTIEDNVFYFYEYNNNGTTCNTYTATSSSDYVFQPMHAYMIQMTGELNFTKNSVPASMAARRINNAQNYDITIELTQNETVTDRAFISIRDSASADFAFNEDMMKIHNSGKTNIYSFAGPYDVAANVLPKENRSIKLGIEASESGMYTIHVPGNFSGIATLFDNVENKRTNLALEDYEIFLEKGKYEDRFFIEIDLNKMPTAIDGVSGGSLKDGKAHKFIQNGQMYILQNGMIYDATGRLVK